MQRVAARLDIKDEGWDEVLMNFVFSEHDLLGLKASTIRSKIGGIRFYHLVSGKNDFAKVGRDGNSCRNGVLGRIKLRTTDFHLIRNC